MAVTVFFSWQSDRPAKTCKSFIEDALEKAVKRISNELIVDEPIRIDRDTEGVSGTPPIFDTICKKIEAAAATVSDVTFVSSRPKGEPSPNPNVLVEYGYALKALTYHRTILVMNTAYGQPGREMPFDMATNRFPIQYCVSEDAGEDVRKAEKQKLVKTFEKAIRDVLQSSEYKNSRPNPVEVALSYRQPTQGHSLFHPNDRPLGYLRHPLHAMLGQPDSETYMSEAPAIWFRLAPKYPIPKKLHLPDLENRVMQLVTLPIFGRASNNYMIRRADGWGCGVMFDPPMMSIVCQVFTDGEVWVIDQFALNNTFDDMDVISLPELYISQSVARCEEFLSQFSISYPLRFIIGIEGVRGRSLLVSSAGFTGKRGACADDRVEVECSLSNPQDHLEALDEFFEQLYQQCGLARQRK